MKRAPISKLASLQVRNQDIADDTGFRDVRTVDPLPQKPGRAAITPHLHKLRHDHVVYPLVLDRLAPKVQPLESFARRRTAVVLSCTCMCV